MTRAVKEVAVWAGLSVTSSATACWTPAVGQWGEVSMGHYRLQMEYIDIYR